MKKTLAVILSLALLFSFCISACAADAFSQYVSEIPEDVAIHCSETVIKRIFPEDLARLIGMTKYSIEPQAVELLRTRFPAFEEAARMNQLSTQIGLEILYDNSDNSIASLAWDNGPDEDGEYYTGYKLIVSTLYLVEKDAAGNPVRDPETGKLRLTTDRERLDEYCCTVTHEMMHAFMADYNHSGMSGFIDPEMASLPAYSSEEEAEAVITHIEAVTFLKWFIEGCATAVENEYAYRQKGFDKLRYFSEEGFDGWYSPEDLQYAFAVTAIETDIDLEELEELPLTFDINVNIYVTGYLACLYLAELAANSEGNSACSVTPDGFDVVDSAVLRSGLNDILRMLHEGVTLDDIIYNISGGRFDDTSDFESAFVVGDYDSAEFCSILLNYMLRLSLESGRRYAPNGSLLFPFDMDYCTLIDYTKNADSELYRIVDSCDFVESTSDLRDVTDAGKSLSYWGYWNDAMYEAGQYYDYDGAYSYSGYPAN